jgi:tRNA(Ile)-lysidine synthase
MLNRFLKNLVDFHLIKKDERLLLTVSGGIDSVAMTHLFHSYEFDFAIAHCNFKLRGAESDEDQLFVANLAKSLNKEFYTKNFDTELFAKEHSISIQMAARDLRYNWFDELSEELHFEKVATAHNRDDVVETFLLNLARGTGIKGLTGIKHLHGKIIRPMLFATRSEIVDYIKEYNYSFREDSSNIEVKYKRNLLRHNIIPLLHSLNPSFTDTIIQETEVFQSVNILYQQKLEEIKKELITTKGTNTIISISKFLALRLEVPVLFDLIYEYGFTYSDVKDIYHSIESQPGKKFFSEKYILTKDRGSFIIEPKDQNATDEVYIIENGECLLEAPIKLKLTTLDKKWGIEIPKNQESVALDNATIKFPLSLRHWHAGDYFYPLGTKGRKKLSDYFIDKKIALPDKNKIWILVSESQIIWIVGYQIDDRNKVTEQTNKILLISVIG